MNFLRLLPLVCAFALLAACDDSTQRPSESGGRFERASPASQCEIEENCDSPTPTTSNTPTATSTPTATRTPTTPPTPTVAPPTATPTRAAPTATATATPTQPERPCDPSYPGVCIPPAPPDLDCPQITFRRFKVIPPDPHGFDGDRDGIGCESN